MFERLLKINGVGGVIAASLLVSAPEEVLSAIKDQNYTFFHGYGFKEKTIKLIFDNFRI